MKDHFQFLKELQKQMKYEDKHDNDIQASPRFWVLRDKRTVPSHGDFADRTQHYFSDGDFAEFDTVGELQEFMEDYYTDGLVSEKDYDYYVKNENIEFEELWDWVINNHNECGHFNDIPVKDEWFIVPNTMFLTKEEAKKHIKLNHYHYTDKVHTYAMTAWRAPKVERLIKILNEIDWDSVTEMSNCVNCNKEIDVGNSDFVSGTSKESMWIHSSDEEVWLTNDYFKTKEEAIKDGMAEHQGYCHQFYVGQVEKGVTCGVDAERVIENIYEDVYDEYGEVATDYLNNVSKKELQELEDGFNKVFEKWAYKHNHKQSFFRVVNIETIAIEE